LRSTTWCSIRPFTKLDLLACRNLLIYFDAALQRRLLPLFHYSLRPGGVLLLGTSETVGRFSPPVRAASVEAADLRPPERCRRRRPRRSDPVIPSAFKFA
jgi:hypothetical protein